MRRAQRLHGEGKNPPESGDEDFMVSMVEEQVSKYVPRGEQNPGKGAGEHS